MKNYYWCKNHPLEEGKTQVFCYHGYDTPFDALSNMSYLKVLYEPAFLDYYLNGRHSLDALRDQYGISIMDMREKYVVCDMMRVEGDEYIEKIALLPRKDQQNIPAINRVLSELRKGYSIKTIDEIMADFANIELSKQADSIRYPLKPTGNQTRFQKMEGAVWSLTETAVAKARYSSDVTDDINEIRDCISELVDYWGLDRRLIDQFDMEVDIALSRETEQEATIGGFSGIQQL